MQLDPKALVRRLTPTATRLLEAAVGRAASGQFYEIVPEHLLVVLLEPEDGDAALLLSHFDKKRSALLARVERSIERLRGGSTGRPVLSQSLFTWLREAWLVASVERGATVVRTADLIAAFAERSDHYSAESYPELEDLPHAEIRKSLYEIVGPSAESGETEARTGTSSAAASPVVKDGKSAALQRFTVSFTQLARDGKIDPVLGRHREIRQLVDILSRRRKNNPILVGEPGVGKTALVEGLARAIVAGEVPEAMQGVELVGLDLGALQAGAGVRGEFEQRLKQVIHDVKASPVPIILFIDEAHTLIGAGGAQGTGDAANLLKPELARGELRTVAATTWSEYKKYFEKDAALERRFQPVKVEEPTEEEAVAILRGLKDTYEKAHGIVIRDDALVAAARLSHRFISGRQLPDKAVDLLDSAAARAKTDARAKPEILVALESDIAANERARDSIERDGRDGVTIDHDALLAIKGRIDALRDQASTLGARWETERSAAERLFSARLALRDVKAGDDAESLRRTVTQTSTDLASLQGDDPLLRLEVDAQSVARVVQSWTGIPVGKLQTDSIRAVLQLEDRMRTRIKGQEAALRVVAESVRMANAGVANPDTPRAVLLFVGTSGVGKTETALALADAIFGGDRFLTSIAMSEFQEKHSVSRLIGSPPGYVGYGEGGVLTEAVRRHPYSVVLLDECEKADLEVMNLFYQVFDKGTLNDGEGRRVDFRNTIVILTSNLATDVIAGMYNAGARPSTEEVLAAIRPTLSRHFKPALLARMTIVPFAPMGPEILRDIVELKLSRLRDRLRAAHGAETEFAPDLVAELTARCTESETGARNIDHVLRGSLLPELSREILQHLSEEKSFRSIRVERASQGFQVTLT
jgi:type VI secretion system protein VasG